MNYKTCQATGNPVAWRVFIFIKNRNTHRRNSHIADIRKKETRMKDIRRKGTHRIHIPGTMRFQEGYLQINRLVVLEFHQILQKRDQSPDT